jgi:hypothetical protein
VDEAESLVNPVPSQLAEMAMLSSQTFSIFSIPLARRFAA